LSKKCKEGGMKAHWIVVCVLCVLASGPARADEQPRFSDYFVDSTLRVDLYHAGDAKDELITLDQIFRTGIWAGNPHFPVDPSGKGRYRVLLYDAASNALIYSRGYDTFFGEYRTSDPAKKGIKRTYHETVLTPFPLSSVLLVIESRDKQNISHVLYTTRIDPADYHILREQPGTNATVINTVINGDVHTTVDLVILAEGYTVAEKEKFEKDLVKFSDVFFSWEPYAALKRRFSIRGVFAPSPESGVDEPRQHSYRHTILGATFNSLDSDRYLTTEQNKMMRDLAGQVPYDAILIMVNSKRYGGGGIYNTFTVFTSDGPWNEHVFHHEFGHAFGGLADEYYTSNVAYDEFYPPGIEPVEANITALLNPSRLKWRDLVTPGLPIPTPWGQEQYDSLNSARDSLGTVRERALAELQRRNAPQGEMEKTRKEFADRLARVNDQIKKFFSEHPLRGKVGAFEGTGYVPKGFYRPTVNSLMNQFNERDRSFFPVNERAIRRVIDFYTE
jgi:hypothetical protein